MKSKFFIFIVIIIVIIGIYFAVKKPSVEAPGIQDQTQNMSSSSTVNNSSRGMEGMSSEDMMNHEQSSIGEKISKHTVFYTDKGFSPSSLEIKAGETVQFINNSNRGMWVASGPHSDHNAYPEFDTKRNIPSGEIYEFTFTRIGEWEYHNHTKTGMYGTVIVK